MTALTTILASRRRLLLPVVLLAASCGDRDADARARTGPLFTLLPSSRTGVAFSNNVPENAMRNGFTYEYYYNGAGVAVGDLNGDDLPDLYFTANMGPNRLYLNRGDLRFEDVTDRAGVAGLRGGWATGVTFADVDGDGRLDIHVSQSGPFGEDDLRRNLLYMNRGERDGIPFFAEEAAERGLADPALSTQAAFFDYDGDGDLDVYLMNHGVPGYRTIPQMRAGRSPAEVDRLYRNDAGRFVDVSDAAGLIDTNLGFGLGVSVSDLDNDGRPDLYVANDYSGRDYLYLGRPGGRFDEVLEASMGHIPLASMGSDIADIDGDGRLDLAVLEMAMSSHFNRKIAERGTEAAHYAQMAREGLHHQVQANALQWNRGVHDGVPVFSEIAYLAGVARTDWSWGALFADFDNDGLPDLFVSNGMAGGTMNADFDNYKALRLSQAQEAEGRVTHSVLVELLEDLPRQRVANRVYRNEGDLTFSDRSDEWGLSEPSYSQGAAYGDLDRDGDLDLVVSNLQGEAFLYRNNAREAGSARYLSIRLEGPAANPFGVGARVRLRAGERQQVQELQLARGYQSSVEPVLHFGLGTRQTVDTLEVVWPDGSREVRIGVRADSRITLMRQDARPAGAAPATASTPLFEDATDAMRPLPRHRPLRSAGDTTLQPYPSARDAVALAAGDLDGDGLDDFVFGGSAGEPTRIYVQRHDGSFAGVTLTATASTAETLAAAIFDADGDTLADIWLVTSEGSGPGRVHRHRLFLNVGGGRFRETAPHTPAVPADGVTLAPGDYDGDGRMDLFVGNRTVPGAGRAPGSLLLRNEPGGFRDATGEVAPTVAELRTVTDAVWADVDGTGGLDLVIAGEWMPVTVLLGDGSRLRDATTDAGLADLAGWWQSLAAADMDGDGDVDLVAGNLGLNYPYRPTPDAPFELFVADFDGDGQEESVPGYHEGGQLYPWYGRIRLGAIVDGIIDRFPTWDAYARQTLDGIVGGKLQTARRFVVTTLATTYFENTGNGRFAAHSLPPAAQLSAVTGIAPADFDGDGTPDLVIAGNLHDLDASVPRLDGGVGLFLSGDGSGGFVPVAPDRSGLWLPGQVRRLAVLRAGPRARLAVLAAIAGATARHLRAVRNPSAR